VVLILFSSNKEQLTGSNVSLDEATLSCEFRWGYYGVIQIEQKTTSVMEEHLNE